MSEWILCEDRLPDKAGEYLVTYRPCYWDDVRDEVKTGIDSFRGKTTWAKKKYQRVIALRNIMNMICLLYMIGMIFYK